MAKRASKDAVAGSPADGDMKWKSALNILTSDIARAKQSHAKAGGDAAAAYKRIEGMGVNKKGAQIVAGIISMEEAHAQDVLRTIVNLIRCADLLPDDLVDLMASGDAGEGEDDDDDGEGDEEDAPPAPQPKPEPEVAKAAPKRTPATASEARQAARSHLGLVPAATDVTH